jgi:phosphoglycolate phosphatase
VSGPVRAALFDLDGTLADTLADIAGAVNEVLAARGLPVHPVRDYLGFVGEGARRLVERALPEDRQALVVEVLGEYHDAYAARLTRETRLYPGIAGMLDGLVAAGIPIAILSNKQDAFTRAVAEALLSAWPFRVIYGERVGVPRKPDPTAALEIARRLEISPEHCAFVGDTAIDMKTATASGMYGIGVPWGFRPREELIASGARVVVASPEDLRERICRGTPDFQ